MHIFTKSIIMSLCLFFATAASGQITGELSITNPDFETGDKSGWTEWSEGGGLQVEIVSDATHSGDNAAKISGETGSFYKTISDEVTLVPGAFYCCVAEVYIPSTDPLQDGQSVHLAGKVTTDSEEIWFESAKKVQSTDAADVWQQLSFGLEYPQDATAITLEFKWTGTDANESGSVIVDDIKIVHMQPPESLDNFSAEDPDDELYGGDGGWWSWAYLPVDPPEGEETWYSDAVSRSGDRSVAMMPQDWDSFSDDWFWGGYYVWSGQTAFDTLDYLHEGDAFYMSAWVMHSSDDPFVGEANVQIELSFKDVNGENLSNLGYADGRAWSPQQLDENMRTDEWQKLEMYIECPTLDEETIVDRIDLVMRLFQTGPAWGVAYIDDVYMARGTEAPSEVQEKNPVVPEGLSLMQNYPNPFNPATTISYSIPQPSHVELVVYDLLGKKVKILVNENQPAGAHTVVFDGSEFTSGTLFYSLKTEDQSVTRKMLLLK